MATYRTVFFMVLMCVPYFALPGTAQNTQEAFENELIASCSENNISKIQSLISEHRLWVKPVVDHLISEYIAFKLTGDESTATSKRKAANLIAQTFQETYGEKSLVIATGYLDGWDNADLEKKRFADSLNLRATSFRKAGEQTDEAIANYQDALNIYTAIGDGRGEADVLGALGFIYWSLDTDTCLFYYQKSLTAREKVDDKQLLSGSLNSIGLVHYLYLSDFETAIEYFSKASIIREEIGDWANLGSTLTYISAAYEQQGNLELAINSYNRSHIINKKAGNQLRMAEAMLNSGRLLQLTGNYQNALEDLQTANSLYKILEDTIGMGDVLTQMALVYANLGDYNTAIEKSTKALQLFQEANDTWGMAGAYNHLGIILQNAGRPERASEYYEKSLGIFEELDDQQNVLTTLNNLGTIFFDLKEYQRAEEYHSRGLQLSRTLNTQTGELHCLLNLANDQNRLGKLDEALSNYESGHQLARSLNSPETTWKIMVGKAENYKLRGDYTKAIEFNEQGLGIIEEIRGSLQEEEYRTTYMARERFAYEDVINMLGELHEGNGNKGYDMKAFQYAQRSKSRSFLDILAQSSSSVPESFNLQHSQIATLKEVQSSFLEKNTVLLEYSLGDSSSYVWVITAKDHQLIKLPARKILQEQIETLRFALLDPQQDNQEFFYKSGHTLYNHLIRPAEKYFSKKSKLIILPDGVLHYLPFEVLITNEQPETTESTFTELPYLVRDYPISYAQSSSVLKNLMENKKKNGLPKKSDETLTAFGDPVYNNKEVGSHNTRSGYSRLKYSGREVEEIALLFQESSREIYLREEAMEENVKKNGALTPFKYIHFATHGLMDEKNPENSSLVLTQGIDSPEDGFLKAAEIYNLEMDADLVVLSACQTGLGKMVRGEGMIGLTRAFMFAGTPSVLASLWSVSDASTTILMLRFYENLIKKKLLKTDALHQAQISMIMDGQYANPFFWAPFVLIGDWK